MEVGSKNKRRALLVVCNVVFSSHLHCAALYMLFVSSRRPLSAVLLIINWNSRRNRSPSQFPIVISCKVRGTKVDVVFLKRISCCVEIAVAVHATINLCAI